ncbi:unnamed protein product [Ilex paraguariensis]|uniref:Zinc finger PHD-type domain-containing protein n=1 Tax=Ilex paraguariensis TaxID=185542 RepID=A0ABC8SPQ9_9AQUA
MEKVEHFSHIHPLICTEVREVNLYIHCYMCRKSISDVVYWCDKCDCYLHKRCAELPTKIEDPLHRQHLLTMRGDFQENVCTSLSFMFGSRLYPVNEDYRCSLCRESRGGNHDCFFYNCVDCEYYICLPCYLEQRVIMSEFHEHPLTFLFRPASFYCNACDKENNDSSSYICHTCNIWIHKSCASFLSTIQFDDQHHPLTLVKLPSSDLSKSTYICKICGTKIYPRKENWLYYCALCEYSIHVRCSISRSKLLRDGESENKNNEHLYHHLVHFPLTDDFVVLARHPAAQISHEEINRETNIKHWSHDHQLILYDGQNNTVTKHEMKHDIISCNGCVQRIALPFYSCDRCNYFLHISCVNLPAELERPNHSAHLFWRSRGTKPHSLFKCRSCSLYGNGFFYAVVDTGYLAFFIRGEALPTLHLKCTFLPNTILHEAHEHPLVQISHLRIECRACHVTCHGIGYRCNKKCNFGICFHCALLPRTLRHRWDAHPLILSYAPIKDHPDEYYCEICEIEIKSGCWIYHCRDCDQSFHPECVQDKYSNVKFGGTHKVEDHPHPLTFTRRVKKVTNYNCGHPFDDEKPLYECAECHFTICLDCIH